MLRTTINSTWKKILRVIVVWALRVADDAPLGRASIAALDDGSLVVVWLEQAPTDGRAQIRARRYPATGAPEAPVTVSTVYRVPPASMLAWNRMSPAE